MILKMLTEDGASHYTMKSLKELESMRRFRTGPPWKITSEGVFYPLEQLIAWVQRERKKERVRVEEREREMEESMPDRWKAARDRKKAPGLVAPSTPAAAKAFDAKYGPSIIEW